jgi:hypothetical protein
LQRIDGHFIRGYGDRSAQPEIYLLSGAIDKAQSLINKDKQAKQRLREVAELIKGFETPYGMELLSTVHWVVKETPIIKEDLHLIVQQVQQWNTRKKYKMKPRHIEKAWRRLKDNKWLQAA